tara:strand:- start:32789 stop:33112 length:324 start_codon:yes stop_codon:yes gene_type:complete
MNFPEGYKLQVKIDEQAKEIEALKTQVEHYQKCVCSTCDGHGFVGNAPDDYYTCPDCQPKEERQLIIDSIHGAGNHLKAVMANHPCCDHVQAVKNFADITLRERGLF